MREAPQWFQDELRHIGGVNPYGEAIFKLLWSPEVKRMIGGRFPDGFEGYREVRNFPGASCWVLMMWEPRELCGSYPRWEWDYRDPATGYIDIGRYPIHGMYRLLQKFVHNEMIEGKLVTWRMEPCGFMLDVMMPMLIRWQKLNAEAKVKALLQEEQMQKDEYLRRAKDAWDGRPRVRRSSALVQRKLEVMERGMKEAMRMAAKTGLGMRQF